MAPVLSDAEALDAVLGPQPDEYTSDFHRLDFVCRWPLPRYCSTPRLTGRQDEEDTCTVAEVTSSPWHAAAALRRGRRAEGESKRMKIELEQMRQELLETEIELHRAASK